MKKFKLKSKIYLIPMIVIFVVVLIIYYRNYKNTVDIIKAEYKSKIKLIEESIYNETKYTEIISKIVEEDIHDDMKEKSKFLIDKYKKDPKVLDWNLKEMKNQMDDMDIYILDSRLKVVASSLDEELGLDFDELVDFSQILEKRLAGDKFESDNLNFSIIEGELRKYGYMPTPDNKYLIELSVNIKDIYPELKNLNIIYLSKELKDKYSFVEDIRVYKFNKHRKYSHELDTANTKLTRDKNFKDDQDKYVKKALDTNESQEHIFKDSKNDSYRFKYIPYAVDYEKNDLAWWKSYVIEVLYNDQNMIMDISHQRHLYFQSISIISFLYFGFSFMIIYLMKKNREIAYKDYLTKLPSRQKFEEIMKYKIEEANNKASKFAVLFFDLDEFKSINDSYGHSFGDKVLQEVANRIEKEVDKEDIVSRLGGDEFAAIISGFDLEEEIVEVVERMSNIFENNFKIGGEEISIRASIGISLYPDHGGTIESLIFKADKAMYVAKKNQIGYNIYKD